MIEVGRTIATLERTITLADMVAYAGATWDWHPLHYDRDFTTERGLQAPVVDGQMLGALMAEQLMDHFGPRAFIAALSFRLKAMVFAGETVRVEGEVLRTNGGTIEVTQTVWAGERLVAEGSARLSV